MKFSNLVEMFPVTITRKTPGCVNRPLTGRIPMDYFVQNEKEILAARRTIGKTRVVFRGPRVTRYAQDTERGDAESVIIYSR